MSFIQRLFALFLFMTLAVANAEPLRIEHAGGVTEFKTHPQKVLVFELAALDTLDALGVPVAGVPNAKMPAALKQYEDAKYAKIGSLFDPDFEAIAAAAPDVIIIGGRTRAKAEQLARIAPVVDLTADGNDHLGSTERNARILGKLFNKEAEVERRIKQLADSSAALKAHALKLGKALILLTTGGKISAYGSGSRFGVIHDQFGMPPADPTLKVTTHGQGVSYEYIVKVNPDWLFVIDRDAAIGRQGKAAAQLLDNPLVAQTKAWKSKQVVYLDPAQMYLTTGGLRTEQAIVDSVAAALAGK